MNAVSDAGAPRRIKVLHIITGLGTGGAERMLVALLEATDRSRFQPEVVSLMGADALGATVRTLGVPLHTLGMRRGLPSPWALPRLRRLVRQCAPDLVHGWMYHGALAALLAARDRPVVVGIHHALHRLEDEKAGTRLVIGALRRVSAGGRAAGLLLGGESAAARALRLPLGQRAGDSERFRLRALSSRCRSPCAVAQGARVRAGALPGWQRRPLSPAEGPGEFPAGRGVAAADRAASALRHGRRRDRLDQFGAADRSGAAGPDLVAAFAGRAPGRAAIAERAGCVRVVVPQRGLPSGAGRGMACAVPCVATDVGDSADMVGDTGAVVPPSDAAALATAAARIAGLDEAERRRLGEAARRRVLSRYSLETVTAAYQALYRQLVEMRATERSVGTITGKG